ncbi:hypothetical protein F5878DRAFT_279445 [Lentinula raphanica]|uniref:Uncharacterized protein n=1 Tax=Lentinula raphanica TaxID=153919 RepID=A0AA38UBI0_9AGAR|nr:hypothetical protein F5878DRAFT_279445 [Lentinula raphanica]
MAETTADEYCAVYIALYRREEEGAAPTSFHWALCYLPESYRDNTTTGFYVYQIIDKDGVWHQSDKVNPLHVEHSNRFHVVIKLGYILADIDSVAEFTSSQPPTQDQTPLLSTHRQWDCTLWVIRVLSQLQEAGLFTAIPLTTDAEKVRFHRRIYSVGVLASTDPTSEFPVVYSGNVKMTQYK